MNEVTFSANHGESIEADPATAEALAIRWYFQLGVDLKLHKGLVQSDDLTVVDYRNNVSSSTVLDPLILDCKHLLSSFKHFAIMFILAKMVSAQSYQCISIYSPNFNLNLISVAKLCNSLSCTNQFSFDKCLIQDKRSMRMIGLTNQVDSLYILTQVL